MNRTQFISKPLTWFVTALLAAVVAGCGGGGGTAIPLNSDKAITSFTIIGAVGVINQTAKTIAITVPNGTAVTALVPTFTITGGVVTVGTPAVAQISSATANNFTAPKVYVVTAADSTTASYTVTVTVAASGAKAITAYSLAGVSGTITGTAISVTMPFGTNVTALVATFSSTGAGVPTIAGVNQVTATTPNNFTTAKVYLVTAADGTTATYTVTVTVALNSAKAITAFSLAGVTGVITEPAHTIAVAMPFGTNVTALVATFTSTGAGVPTIAGVNQVSATTANNFTTAKAYLVTAADGTTATYTVTVTVALNSAKAITAFSLAGVNGVITEPAHTIAVSMPFGTNVTSLVATFTSTGAGVPTIAGVNQLSASTVNNFTTAKAYLVTAADSTTATYTVTVTVAAAPSGQVVCGGASGTNCVDLGTAANYVILDEATVTFTPIANITTTATITGDVAVSPAAAVFLTGFTLALDPASCFSTSTQVVGKLYAADYSSVNGCATATTDTATILTTAVGDKNGAYSAALLKAPAGGGLITACPGGGAMSDGTGGGSGGPIAAGVYNCAVNVTIPGDLTLNGNATDVWVFQITGTLSQAGATNVLLTGGALPQNVFWIVSNGVSVGAGAHMEGVVMSATNISLITGATVKGRLFGRTGVLMDSNSVTQP